MLFRFSGDNWLGLHLGMTGTLRIEPRGFSRRQTRSSRLCNRRSARSSFAIRANSAASAFITARSSRRWWSTDVPEIVSARFDSKFRRPNFWTTSHARRSKRSFCCKTVSRNRQLDGGRNSVARENLCRHDERGKLLQRERAALSPRRRNSFRANRCESSGHDNSDPPRIWLIHQRWKAGGICPIHGTPLAARDDRRPHHRLVSALSELIDRYVDHDLVESGRA